MTQNELHRTFVQYAENTGFLDWRDRHKPVFRFVYLVEYGTVWKFTPKEWWLFVTKTIQKDGAYDLPLSMALRSRPKHISRSYDGMFYSSDPTVRCVTPLNWALDDWKNELG